ncbi:MAG: mechanosensitive ion channel [Oscillatoria sp. SIO1A7]|nr:mechanosensitive ion channel [Oscillatoria sp. SIO1A7]
MFETLWNIIQENTSIYNLPLDKIIIVVAIIFIALVSRHLFLSIVISHLKRLAQHTQADLDYELIEVLKQPLSFLILIGSLWAIELVVGENLSPQLQKTLLDSINLAFIFTLCLILFRSAGLLGEILKNLALHTETEIDDIIAPYMPLFFRTLAAVILLLKTGEVLLGASATALIGLIGGAGITLGLLFKDIISDWFATIIIYADNLYRPGDLLVVSGIDGMVRVLAIGIRSTKVRPVDRDSIYSMPNSLMITGRVENWSPDPKAPLSIILNASLKIDGISAREVALICSGIREIPKSVDYLHDDCVVWFGGFERNARVIKIRVFVKELSAYFQGWDELNLHILALLEQEGINLLYVDLKANIDYQEWQEQKNKVNTLP